MLMSLFCVVSKRKVVAAVWPCCNIYSQCVSCFTEKNFNEVFAVKLQAVAGIVTLTLSLIHTYLLTGLRRYQQQALQQTVSIPYQYRQCRINIVSISYQYRINNVQVNIFFSSAVQPVLLLLPIDIIASYFKWSY